MAEPRIRITAVDDASRTMASVSGKLDAMGVSAGRLGTAFKTLGAGLSVGAMASLFRGLNDGVDALNDLSDATKASIENLSALEDVGDRTGTSFETVGGALVKFNQALSDAKPGSDAAEAFRVLGLQVNELKRLDPAEALRQTAVALAGFADDGNKARLVQELFGRSVREVAPFLKDLAEQGSLVAKVTTAQAEAAEKFNLELFNLEKNAKDAGRAMTSDLVTGINAAAKAFRESGLSAGLGTLFFGNDQFRNDKALTQQTEELLQLEQDITRLRSSGIALEAAQARKKEERLKVLREEIKTTQTYRKVLADAANPAEVAKPSLPPSLTKPKPGPKADPAVQATSELDRYAQSLLVSIERSKDLSEVERARVRISEAGGQGFSEFQRRYVLGLAEQVDAAKNAAEAERSLIESRTRAAAMTTARLDAIITENDAIATNNQTLREHLQEIGLTAAELDRLRLTRLDDAIAIEQERLAMARNIEGNEVEIQQIERRIRLRQDERGIVSKSIEKRTETDEEAENKKRTDRLAESIETGILTGFRDGGRAADIFLDELKSQFGKTVLRPLIQPIAEAGNKLLSAGITSLFSSFGLPSFAGGGYTGSSPRTGGIDGKGGFLSLLHPQEDVVDHAQGQRIGGTTTVIQNFTVGDVASMNAVRKAIAHSQRASLVALHRSRIYGGIWE